MPDQKPEDANPNYQMSPLAALLMSILGKGALYGGGLLLLFTGLLLYQRWTPNGPVLSRQDYGMIGIMVAMFFLALYIVRSISREMKNPGS